MILGNPFHEHIHIGNCYFFLRKNLQRAKKVVSHGLGLVDLAIGLVKYVFNLPDGQVMFFEEFE